MKFAHFASNGRFGLGMLHSGALQGLLADDPHYPDSLDGLIATGAPSLESVGATLREHGRPFAVDAVEFLPPLATPGKIVCVGLNYADHAAESGLPSAAHPVLFARFHTSLIGHGQALVRPRASTQLDYEGELVAIIGRRGRHIAESDALAHVIAYSIFNDASVRDYQLRTSQWTAGKNFDATGAFGPYLTLASALPAGARGLSLETRLNGELLQSASTSQMIFSVAKLISLLSEFMTLEPGDILVTGTPSGLGFVRKPPIFMQPGDVCEVSIEGIGTLRNPVRDEEPSTARTHWSAAEIVP